MNNLDKFSSINFDRLRIPLRLIAILGVIFVQILAWRFLNPNILFLLNLLMVGILVWVASYGWRQAVTVLINFLIKIIT